MNVHSQNNFGALRLYLATTVFLYHIFALSQNEHLWALSGLDPEFAVRGFFVVSGYLIAGSAMRARTVGDYWRNRALRILPAYWAALILGVLLAAVSVQPLDLSKLWSGATARYLVANLIFLNFLAPDIPPAFAQNAYHAINGSLWTIKIEVGFYVIAPLLVRLFSWRRPLLWLVIIYCASVAYLVSLEQLYVLTGKDSFLFLARQLPGQMSYFAVGMAWHLVTNRNQANLARIFFAGSALFLVARYVSPVSPWLTPMAIGAMILSLAYWPCRLSRLEDFGDLSYGVYVYHFPVLQTMIAFGIFASTSSAIGGAVLAVGAVFILAAMSWFWLERPLLNTKRPVAAAGRTGLPPRV